MGGNNNIEILVSEQTDSTQIDLYGENKDQQFGTGMLVSGATYIKTFK